MTEQYGFKFVVDANDAAKGWKQFESAVEGVFKSLDKMEAHVGKSMASLKKNMDKGKKDLTAFNKAVGELGKIKISNSSTRNIAALSAAMKGFKAPSAAQVKNTNAFFKALTGAGNGGGATAARNIAALGAATTGFKAPTAANITNIRELFKALAQYPSGKNFTNAAGMLATLRQLQGFKAPSAAQVKNLQAFLNTVANLKIPQNGAQVAKNLDMIARAATAANANLRGLRGNIGSFNYGRFNSGTRQASLNMMGLQNAFSGTFQVGSALRVLLGSLTIGELGRNFFEATNAALQFKAQMSVVNKEAGFAALQLDYVNAVANRFGVDMLAAEQGFAKISIAADKSGISVGQTRHIFEGMTTAMSVLGISTAGQGDVWLALQQVMNKGYLSAEELNQQLNEKLPGAMAYATEYANSLGLTLEKGLKTKALDAAGVLEHISKRMKEDFGPAVAAALERPSAQMNILRNNFMTLFQAIGENGGNEAFVDLLKMINEQMTPEKIEHYARVIGEGLKSAVEKVSDAFRWLRDNWDSIKGPLATTLELMGKWMIVSSALQIGRFIISPLMMIGGALGGLQEMGKKLQTGATAALGMARGNQALSASQVAATATGHPFRTMLVAQGVAARGSAVGVGALTVALRTLAGAQALAATGLRSLVALLGGPLLLTIGAVAYAVYQLYDEWSSGHKVIETTGDLISDTRKKVDEATKSIYLNKNATGENKGMQGMFSSALDLASGYMDTYKRKLDEATGGLYSMAAAAKAAAIENLKLAQTDLTNRLNRVKLDDSDSIFQAADHIMNDKNRGGLNRTVVGAGAYIYGGLEWMQDVVGWNAPMQARKESIADLNAEIARTNALLKEAEGKSEFEIIEEMRKRGYQGSGPITRMPGETDEKGNKRKGRTPPDPEKEAERLRRKIDGIMRRLAEDNPLAQLSQDYMEDLGRQAEMFLSTAGFNKWQEAISKPGMEAQDVLIELQEAMRGAGADTAVLTEIQKRYGMSVDDLTLALDDQLDAYRDKRREMEKDLAFGTRIREGAMAELQLTRLSTVQQKVLAEVMAEVNRTKHTKQRMDQEGIDLLTQELMLMEKKNAILKAQKEFYENNGLKTYQNDIRTAGELAHDLDKDVLGSLEEQLTRLGTTGQFSFKAIIGTLQQGLVRWSAQGITSKIGSMLSDKDPNNPSIFGGLLRTMGFDTGFDATKAGERFDNANVSMTNARVNIQGQLFGEGWGNSLLGGTGGSDQIVVSGTTPYGLKDEIARPLEDAAQQVGKTMRQDWGGAVRGIGGVLQRIAQSLVGGGGSSGLLGGALNIGMSLLGGGPTAAGMAKLAPGVSSMMAANAGIFKEGGYVGSPVARASGIHSFANAPHYAEGTANTSGGHPAILHDNEAVIPLSRGRKVPVQLTNGGDNGSKTVVNNNWNIQTPDADSFRRSQRQMSGQMHRAVTRATMRNH